MVALYLVAGPEDLDLGVKVSPDSPEVFLAGIAVRFVLPVRAPVVGGTEDHLHARVLFLYCRVKLRYVAIVELPSFPSIDLCVDLIQRVTRVVENHRDPGAVGGEPAVPAEVILESAIAGEAHLRVHRGAVGNVELQSEIRERFGHKLQVLVPDFQVREPGVREAVSLVEEEIEFVKEAELDQVIAISGMPAQRSHRPVSHLAQAHFSAVAIDTLNERYHAPHGASEVVAADGRFLVANLQVVTLRLVGCIRVF